MVGIWLNVLTATGASVIIFTVPFTRYLPKWFEGLCLGLSTGMAGYALIESRKLPREVAIANARKHAEQRMMATEMAYRVSAYEERLRAFYLEPLQTTDYRTIDAPIQPPAQLPSAIDVATVGDILKSGCHWLLIGETGSGKSVLATLLACNASQQGSVMILDPHYAPGDWQGFNVVGGGRDYPAINAAMDWALNEMQRRYELRDRGQPVGPLVTIVADELPSLMANCELAGDWLKILTREARKVGIRLMLLTQGAEVKALKLDGEGSVRQAFTYVRLGKSALDFSKSTKDQELIAAVRSLPRPSMLNDMPLQLPEIDVTRLRPVHTQPMDVNPVQRVTPAVEKVTPISNPLQKYVTRETWELYQECSSLREFERRLFGFVGGSAHTKAKALLPLLEANFGGSSAKNE